MKLTRNYLKSAEIALIVGEMLEKENPLEREVLKVGLIVQILCGDIGEYEDCSDIYDDYIAQDDFEIYADIKNAYLIDDCIAQEIGIEKMVKGFLDAINEKIEKSLETLPESVKDFNFGDMINQFKEVTNNGKEDIQN